MVAVIKLGPVRAVVCNDASYIWAVAQSQCLVEDLK